MRISTKQSGISLVEILISLVISLFLLGGIIQVYLGNKTTFAFTNAIAEIQENGRFALETVAQDLRLSGDWGCVAYDPDDTSNINSTLAATLAGYDDDLHDYAGEEATEGTNNTGLNNSDTLTIRGSKTGQMNVEGPFTAANTQSLNVNSISNLVAGDIILIARCGANDLLVAPDADIIEVTAVDVGAQTITLAANKSQQFENDATIKELQTVTYSVQAGASGEPSLFRSEFGVDVELVEGIEELQILYGIDTDSDAFANQYVVSNDPIMNFPDVVSVRIMLLVRSLDDFVTEVPQTYTFNGATVTPADNRIRQVFTATVALRNRIGTL